MNIADTARCDSRQSMSGVSKRSTAQRVSKNAAAGASVGLAGTVGETPVLVELSQEGKSLAEEAAVRKEPTSYEVMLEKIKQQQVEIRKNAWKTAKSKKKKKSSYGNMSRALAIARRIMKGDKVPPKDESFLFRYNSDLYLKAKMMAVQNQNPKKHKSLLEELQEEESGGSPSAASSSSGTTSEGTETPGDSESESSSEEE